MENQINQVVATTPAYRAGQAGARACSDAGCVPNWRMVGQESAEFRAGFTYEWTEYGEARYLARVAEQAGQKAFAKSRQGTNDWTILSYDENWAEEVVAEGLTNEDANATLAASNAAGHLILTKNT